MEGGFCERANRRGMFGDEHVSAGHPLFVAAADRLGIGTGINIVVQFEDCVIFPLRRVLNLIGWLLSVLDTAGVKRPAF